MLLQMRQCGKGKGRFLGDPRASAAALLLLTATSASASAESVRAGEYQVVAQMVMPHLEENLRYAVVRESRCLARRNLASIFPILRHQSFTGCELASEGGSGSQLRYRLRCKSAEVATGTAWLDPGDRQILGELHVRMGGKNMTFSQRIRATYRGECGDVQ